MCVRCGAACRVYPEPLVPLGLATPHPLPCDCRSPDPRSHSLHFTCGHPRPVEFPTYPFQRILTPSPADTPFEDGSFRLTLTFTDSYPNKPPTVRFVSRMFHPNIYNNGELCLDILQNRWSPTYDVAAILTSVQSLLNDPNPSR